MMRPYFVGVIITVLTPFFLLACEESAPTPTPQPISVTASDLVNEFEANEVRANDKYEGKWVRVTGKVKVVEEDIFEDESLTLDAGFWGVKCDYTDETESVKARQLNIGDSVTVVGEVSDYLLTVNIEHCEILP